jgi:hypothetical protein
MRDKGRRQRPFLIPLPSSLIPFFLLLATAVCCNNPRASSPAKQTILWSKLGQWSGHGNLQTESFIGTTGYLRATWETAHETSPGAGRFRLIVGSSISGRQLMVMADARGASHSVSYLNEEARTFYALVESSDVDWTFTIDEGYPATVEDKPAR